MTTTLDDLRLTTSAVLNGGEQLHVHTFTSTDSLRTVAVVRVGGGLSIQSSVPGALARLGQALLDAEAKAAALRDAQAAFGDDQ